MSFVEVLASCIILFSLALAMGRFFSVQAPPQAVDVEALEIRLKDEVKKQVNSIQAAYAGQLAALQQDREEERGDVAAEIAAFKKERDAEVKNLRQTMATNEYFLDRQIQDLKAHNDNLNEAPTRVKQEVKLLHDKLGALQRKMESTKVDSAVLDHIAVLEKKVEEASELKTQMGLLADKFNALILQNAILTEQNKALMAHNESINAEKDFVTKQDVVKNLDIAIEAAYENDEVHRAEVDKNLKKVTKAANKTSKTLAELSARVEKLEAAKQTATTTDVQAAAFARATPDPQVAILTSDWTKFRSFLSDLQKDMEVKNQCDVPSGPDNPFDTLKNKFDFMDKTYKDVMNKQLLAEMVTAQRNRTMKFLGEHEFKLIDYEMMLDELNGGDKSNIYRVLAQILVQLDDALGDFPEEDAAEEDGEENVADGDGEADAVEDEDSPLSNEADADGEPDETVSMF